MSPEEGKLSTTMFSTGDSEIRVIDTGIEGDLPLCASVIHIDSEGNETKTTFPFVELELDDREVTGPFVLRAYKKSKEVVGEHKMATAFTLATVITGIATGIMVTRHNRGKK